MSLTRKMLKAMGIEDEKVDQIIEAHTETVEALKEKAAAAEKNAKSVPELQKQLQKAQDDLKAAKQDDWKDKHDALKRQFDDYKAEQTAKELGAAKERAVRAYFEGKNITGKNLELAMRASGEEINAVELVDGKLKDTAALDTLIAGAFAGLVSNQRQQGAKTSNPPATGGSGFNRAEIYKKDERGRYLLSAAERQKAIAEQMAQAE